MSIDGEDVPTYSESLLRELDLCSFEPKSLTKLRAELAEYLASIRPAVFDLPEKYKTKDSQCGT